MPRPSSGFDRRVTRPSASRRSTALVTLAALTCRRSPILPRGRAPLARERQQHEDLVAGERQPERTQDGIGPGEEDLLQPHDGGHDRHARRLLPASRAAPTGAPPRRSDRNAAVVVRPWAHARRCTMPQRSSGRCPATLARFSTECKALQRPGGCEHVTSTAGAAPASAATVTQRRRHEGLAMTRFPHGFLWGAATAGHQVEGGNVNADMWPMEWAENSTLQRAVRRRLRPLPPLPRGHRAARRARTHRLPLLPRVVPDRTRAGLLLAGRARPLRADDRELPADGVTPVVTYNHFTVPRWMAGRGGWSAADAPARFADYAARVTQHFGDLLSWVCTLNEPNLMAMMRSTGVLAMGAGDRSPRLEPVESGRGRCRRLRPVRATGWGSWRPTSSTMADGTSTGGAGRSRRRPATSRRAGPWRSWTSRPRRVARSGGTRHGGWARPTGSPSRPTTTSSACRRTPAPASDRTASSPCPTGRPPCRPDGRSTPRRSATRSASPPNTPACPSSSPRTGWRPTTTRRGSPTPVPRSRDWPGAIA